MTDIDKLKNRYNNDATFHTVVDSLQAIVLRLELSPSEIREAAMYACFLIEMKHGMPRAYYAHEGDDNDQHPYRGTPR